jgi:formylglycine-generating enzyme required for sulfatase activity
MASPPPAKAPLPERWRILRWGSRQLAYREPLAEGVSLTMLRIPAGSFWMGAPEGEAGSKAAERPVHRVTLGEFLLGQTPVTQAQWRAVAKWERQENEDEGKWPPKLDPDPVARLDDPYIFRGDQRPVVTVSWKEATAFCQRLRLRTGKNYTLPSEAQWEYACRAGTTTPFHFGATISTELANYDGQTAYGDGPKGIIRRQTTPVGIFPANSWGLQDMHGNVWEWCADHWHDNYKGAPEDGRAWLDENADEDQRRLSRGGAWLLEPQDCRSAYRIWWHPDDDDWDRGLRVCCLPQDMLLYP